MTSIWWVSANDWMTARLAADIPSMLSCKICSAGPTAWKSRFKRLFWLHDRDPYAFGLHHWFFPGLSHSQGGRWECWCHPPHSLLDWLNYCYMIGAFGYTWAVIPAPGDPNKMASHTFPTSPSPVQPVHKWSPSHLWSKLYLRRASSSANWSADCLHIWQECRTAVDSGVSSQDSLKCVSPTQHQRQPRSVCVSIFLVL